MYTLYPKKAPEVVAPAGDEMLKPENVKVEEALPSTQKEVSNNKATEQPE
jgi:hypothetical protein